MSPCNTTNSTASKGEDGNKDNITTVLLPKKRKASTSTQNDDDDDCGGPHSSCSNPVSPLREEQTMVPQHDNDNEDNTIQTSWAHYRAFLDSENGDEEEQEGCGGGGGGGGGDIDELQMIIELLEPKYPPQKKTDVHGGGGTTITVDEMKTWFTSERSLIPVLLSMSYLHLGSDAISQGFTSSSDATNHDDDGDGEDDNNSENPSGYLMRSLRHFPSNAAARSMLANYNRMNMLDTAENICREYERAGEEAQVVREGSLLILRDGDDECDDGNGDGDGDGDDEEEEEEESGGGGYKEWVELLLLDGVAGVHYIGDDDDEEENEEEEEEINGGGNDLVSNCDEEMIKENDITTTVPKLFDKETTKANTTGELEQDDNDDNGTTSEEYSMSQVEATASFMAALLHCTLNRQDEALRLLRKFQITHRIHPNVWKFASSSSLSSSIAPNDGNCNRSSTLFDPISFRGRQRRLPSNSCTDDGILPPSLYRRMCDVFAPSAAYWRETDYDNRGYYSFFHDLPPSPSSSNTTTTTTRKNLIETVVIDHLLPLVQSHLAKSESEGTGQQRPSREIVGFEWWAHTRPKRANLGHQLHFDTDETLLSQAARKKNTKKDVEDADADADADVMTDVTHPIASSVLYLTGNDQDHHNIDLNGDERNGADNVKEDHQRQHPAGATIVFDQTPHSKHAASKAWISQPCDNSFMIFPGDLLHGVLPCGGGSATTEQRTPVIGSNKSTSGSICGKTHRLTFMVGFWTRRVPNGMKNQNGEKNYTLYGPCRPLPPATGCDGLQHTWVNDIVSPLPPVEIDHNGEKTKDAIMKVRMKADSCVLPCIFPAWEPLHGSSNDVDAGGDGCTGEEICHNSDGLLEIPKSLDHRFFVNDPSTFFRESLFKDESF